jgi:hypothetical protein
MVAAKAFRLRLDRVDGDGISSVHGAPLTSKNLMKKTRFNETRRSGSKNRSHLLYLHTNTGVGHARPVRWPSWRESGGKRFAKARSTRANLAMDAAAGSR